MAAKAEFFEACEALFAEELGYGRRWKSAAAQALGIGRATLYRYFEDETGVPTSVWDRLRKLTEAPRPVRSDQEMVALIARALLDVQEELDAHGWLKNGYPLSLQRVFDLSSARNAFDPRAAWPCDMRALASKAACPLFDWAGDMSWDPEGNYTAETLLKDGEVTDACIDLAAVGRDPEMELIERNGFERLRRLCLDRTDGQEIYTALRRAVIQHPVLSNWTTVILADEVLASVEGIEDVIEAFYQPIPEALSAGGAIPICKVSGLLLRRLRNGFHTECRDPAAIEFAKAGEFNSIDWSPRAKQLRRAYRLYWCLPGLSELTLAQCLETAGWTVDLWPKLDRVDLVAKSQDRSRKIAVDVKDYLSPISLATRFAGFKSYAATHDCFLVVPDYIADTSPGYERTFRIIRSSYSKTPVVLRTISGLLEDLEACQ